MSLKDSFDTAMSISRAFSEKTAKPISRKNCFASVKLGNITDSDSMQQTFDFKEESKGLSWLRHRGRDKGTIKYGSL